MTVSKTVLLQMRFIGMGAPFACVTAKPSIDTTGVSEYIDKGGAFLGANAEITPPTYSISKAPSYKGHPFKNLTAKSSIDASYGVYQHKGHPFYIRFSGTSVYPFIGKYPVKQGAPFKLTVAKSSIDASGFDFIDEGGPVWIAFTGAPPPFNTTRFFLLF